MRRVFGFFAMIVLVLVSTSCDIGSVTLGEIETGPTVTEDISVPLPDGATTSEVVISMGGGDLSIDVGEVDGLLKGTVSYNAEDLKPSVQTSGSRVVVEQGDLEGKRIPLGNWSDVENVWELTLGTAPMVLTVNAGAAGAILTNLADLNAGEITLRGGAADVRLDFAGDLKQDMNVTIDAGAAQVTIVVPDGRAAELTFQGALTDIDADGAWQKSGNRYVLEGEGPRVTFTVRMGVGDLNLRNR